MSSSSSSSSLPLPLLSTTTSKSTVSSSSSSDDVAAAAAAVHVVVGKGTKNHNNIHNNNIDNHNKKNKKHRTWKTSKQKTFIMILGFMATSIMIALNLYSILLLTRYQKQQLSTQEEEDLDENNNLLLFSNHHSHHDHRQNQHQKQKFISHVSSTTTTTDDAASLLLRAQRKFKSSTSGKTTAITVSTPPPTTTNDSKNNNNHNHHHPIVSNNNNNNKRNVNIQEEQNEKIHSTRKNGHNNYVDSAPEAVAAAAAAFDTKLVSTTTATMESNNNNSSGNNNDNNSNDNSNTNEQNKPKEQQPQQQQQQQQERKEEEEEEQQSNNGNNSINNNNTTSKTLLSFPRISKIRNEKSIIDVEALQSDKEQKDNSSTSLPSSSSLSLPLSPSNQRILEELLEMWKTQVPVNETKIVTLPLPIMTPTTATNDNGNDNDNKNDKKSIRGITITTHLGISKLHRFSIMVQRYGGPVSAAIYITNPMELQILLEFQQQELKNNPNIHIHVLLDWNGAKYNQQYPYNVLRQIALDRIPFNHFFFTLDVDFVTPPNAHEQLQTIIIKKYPQMEKALIQEKILLVIPAFERTEEAIQLTKNRQQEQQEQEQEQEQRQLENDRNNHNANNDTRTILEQQQKQQQEQQTQKQQKQQEEQDWIANHIHEILPNNTKHLLQMVENNEMVQFHGAFSTGHGATDYNRWYTAIQKQQQQQKDNNNNNNNNDGNNNDNNNSMNTTSTMTMTSTSTIMTQQDIPFYYIDYQLKYEPYVIGYKHDDLTRYWQHFHTYHYNKYSWIMELFMDGFQLAVLTATTETTTKIPSLPQTTIQEKINDTTIATTTTTTTGVGGEGERQDDDDDDGGIFLIHLEHEYPPKQGMDKKPYDMFRTHLKRKYNWDKETFEIFMSRPHNYESVDFYGMGPKGIPKLLGWKEHYGSVFGRIFDLDDTNSRFPFKEFICTSKIINGTIAINETVTSRSGQSYFLSGEPLVRRPYHRKGK